MPGWYLDLLSLLLGLFVGSFLNVVIYRVPRRKSIVYPPSACPTCQAPIAFYDNIPVLSFLILRGRCRKCGQPIALRYPAVELLTALLFLALALKFRVSWELLRGLVLAGLLIAIGLIDLETKRIPDAISLPGIAAGLLTSLLVPGELVPALRGLIPALIGAAVGAGVIFLLRWLWRKVMKKEGLGPGDIPLAALLGAFLGWRLVLLAIFIGAGLGVLGGVLAARIRRKAIFGRQIAFGPFLAIAGLVVLFFGPAILNWYWNLFRR